LGIEEYFRRLSGDRRVSHVRDQLMARLVSHYEKHATPIWPWFEDILSYDNARLPQALIAAGRASGNSAALEIGMTSLRWLVEQQTSPQDHFRPIGSNGFYRRGEERAQFDQQPLEACATVAACLEAYRAQDDNEWLREASNAFEWYLGRNDLGLELYDPITGACNDGLQEDRVNQNQGAEATLSFLTALAELELFASALAAFRRLSESDQVLKGPHLAGSKISAHER
jgi:uncharacterized protein YyaL (SSP411 family)